MSRRAGHEVAVVGMACIFPGAPDVATFWHNIVSGYDAIRTVPEGRWDRVFHDPDSHAVDRIYTNRGGFIDEFASFDALHFGVMPVAARASEPDQLLMLEVASAALRDAGYEKRKLPAQRTGVILGRGGYLNAGTARLVQKVRIAQELVECLRAVVPGITEEQLAELKREYQSKIGHIGPDTVIGLVPNLAASRIANRLDLGGPAYTVDAACASSLIAVDRACIDLIQGDVDVVIAGGVHLTHDVTFWSVFCQLGALSRQGMIRPFSKHADGLLIGEGLGAVVLKRLADAERDGDEIYAVIRATGVASDGRETSVMNPGAEGQIQSLARAWSRLDVDPRAAGAIGLIEAHGTATPAGDGVELRTLATFFGRPEESPAPVIGSVKSMIGHAMPAAGIAGLIKAVMAVREGVLPPTLHAREARAELARTRFRLLARAEPWKCEGPRRAAINAFGFGGINAHVVIEQHASAAAGSLRAATTTASILLIARSNPAEILAALDAPGAEMGSGPCRLAVQNPNPERMKRARAIVERGAPLHDRSGIGFTPQGLLSSGGKLVFLFPGVDADFRPMVRDVAARFGEELPPELQALITASAQSRTATELERTGVGVILVNRLLADVLRRLGLRPDFVAGHSIGEWSGMVEAGVFEPEVFRRYVSGLNAGMLRVPGVAFGAVGAGIERVRPCIADLPDVTVSQDNCPHQVVLCGREESLDEALARLKQHKIICQKLPFRSGFHSSLFADYLADVEQNLAGLDFRAPAVPLWSATTCSPYPSAPGEIRRLFLEHLVKPVRFRELIEAQHAAGARVFVQAGTGSLVGFVNDILAERPHLALASNVARRSGLDQLRLAAAALWVEGAPVRPQELFELSPVSGGRRVHLELGAPIVRPDTRVQAQADPWHFEPADAGGDPVVAEFNATLQELARHGRDVVLASRTLPQARTRSVTRRKLSLESDPDLIDHAFFPQPEGWPHTADRFPLVPMTMSIELMARAARELVPGKVVVAVEGIRALRWLEVGQPVEVEIAAVRREADAVEVSIENYIHGTIRLAASYPEPPAAKPTALCEEGSVGLTVEQTYRERWMFHGPAYHAISALLAQGDDGMRGRIRRAHGTGSLLDGAGQLLGLWISRRMTKDRMALPVRVNRIRFFGPEPAIGLELDCVVRIRDIKDNHVTGDIEISRGGRVWAHVDGWTDRRFESDPLQWKVIQFPELHTLSVAREDIPGSAFIPRVGRGSAILDYFAARYLDSRALAHYRTMLPKQQIDWLSPRIAAIDAVRQHLWARGRGPLFPIEVDLADDELGRPRVSVAGTGPLSLSMAGQGGVGIAIVGEGEPVGIDLERIEPRDASADLRGLGPAELALLPPDANRVEWLARLRTAKSAAAKAALAPSGEAPDRFEATAIAGERVLVSGHWVHTLRDGEWIVAWVRLPATRAEREEK